MRFVFDERKTAQAAAYLMNKAGGSLNYMALIKLLYLADRRALIERGAPITGDKMVAMPHGPVLSRVLDQINMGTPDGPSVWHEYVSDPIGRNVSARQEETNELSRFELRLLDDIFARFGHMDRFALRDLTHTLPEWDDPHGSSCPIDPTEILRADGKSDSEITAIVADAEEVWRMDSLSHLFRVGLP